MASSQQISPNGFNTLLVAADLSPRSKRALSCAAALARGTHARILVAHVTPPDRPGFAGPDEIHPALCPERKRTEKKIAQLLTSERLDGIDTDTVIKPGLIAQTLRDIACQRRADLLVAAIHGRKGLSKLLFGSKVEAVCQCAPCPILLIGPNVRQVERKFERVIFATDLSSQSLGALPLVLAFAAQYRSQLKVLRIVSQMNGDADTLLQQAKVVILPALTVRAGLAHTPQFAVRCGNAREQIVEAADEWSADVVGVGAHRPGTLSTYLSGDLAYDIACDANCAVLTVVD